MTRRDVPDANGWAFDEDREQRQASLALARRLDRARKRSGKLTMTVVRRAKSKAKGTRP